MKKNMAKELRSKRMKYIDEMGKVKPLALLPGLNVATIAMVADYLEADQIAVNSYYSAHKKELEEYGVIKLNANNFADSGYTITDATRGHKIVEKDDVKIIVTNTGLRCMSETAVFNMALGLICSPVADQIREAVKKVEAADSSNVEVVSNAAQEPSESPETVESAVETVSDIRTFTNVEFGSVRIVINDGEPWFVGKDVADILSYKNSRDAFSKHVDIEDKGVAFCDSLGGKQKTTIINESGLYSLIMSSKLPTAKKFKRWITAEVLPSVRKHGAYMTPETLEKAILNPDFLIELATKLKEEQEKNRELTATNKVLSDKVNTWEPKSVINALIRSYAACCFNNDYAKAFSDYYKQLSYKHHINVKSRRTASGKELPLIEYIRDNEMDSAVKLAVAICEACGINTGKVINEVNLSLCGC